MSDNEGKVSRRQRRSAAGARHGDRQQGSGAGLLRRIAAGLPIYSQQEWDGSVVVNAAMLRGRSLFALQVKGDSIAARFCKTLPKSDQR